MSKLYKKLFYIFIIIAFVVFSPFLIGQISKNNIYNIVSKLNNTTWVKSNNLHITVRSYKSGWLKSNEKIKIIINKNNHEENLTIYNGPLYLIHQ